MLFDISDIPITTLDGPLFREKEVAVSVLRLDMIHPFVSGNKLFKLHFYLQQAIANSKTGILTFGGAWSNHLLATACACKMMGLQSIGVVRGEQSHQLSGTLQQCMDLGMQLEFISREQYAVHANERELLLWKHKYGQFQLVPEGGYGLPGAKGAALIMDLLKEAAYSHVIVAVGTATTIAGFALGAQPRQKITGVPVLKGMSDIPERILALTGDREIAKRVDLLEGYHFGGYAKRTTELIHFMNTLWKEHGLPTDFVYTGKLFFAVMDQLQKDHFAPGSHILCVHTGGLPGNNSLPVDTLLF